MRISVLPKDPRPSGWYAILPEAPPVRQLTGRQTADWVVVGAGFTGVAAARRLGELAPNDRIVLIEAQRAGMGASGRNSGFVIDVPHNSDASAEKAQANSRMLRLNRFAIAWLRELVEKHQIRCDWQSRGQYRVAATAAGVRAAKPIVGLSEALAVPHETLSREQIAARLGTTYYAAAVYQPGTILMNPAALMRGLAHTLPANVEVYEDSPVTSIDYGPPHRLRTAVGEIATPKLILATNGFTDGWGFLERHLIRLATYASLTRPLNDKQLAMMGSDENWGATCTIRMGSTVRRTADNRLMMRNCVRYGGDTAVGERELAHARRNHVQSLKARFPQLGEPAIEHTWGGFICVSRNSAPYWGELAPGVLASVCCNGVGVPKGTFAGRAIAEYALGHDSELVRDLRAFPKAANHGLGPFVSLATSLRLKYQQMFAGREH
jgi:glycine/D-amino acid oxidase-like deaminating enzyme